MQISLSSLGAVADVREISDAAMAASSTSLSSATADFTAGDVGKTIVVGGAGASGTKLVATVSSVQSATAVTLSAPAATAVSDKGAAWGTDCSTALAAGLAAISAARGGVLEVDGLFLLANPVSCSFGGETDVIHATIRGTGSDSALWIATAASADAITLSSAEIDFIDLNFVGVPGATIDARRILDFTGLGARLDRCGFYGLAVSEAVIHASGCALETRSCRFGGSFTLGGVHSVIENKNWIRYSDDNSHFIDYGYFRSRYYGKSGDQAGNLGWVRADSPTTALGARGAGVFRMCGTVLDEGSRRGIVVKPTAGTVPHVMLDGLRQNITPAEGGRGFHFENVGSAIIRHCWQGWAATSALVGHFQDCGTVEIDSLKLSNAVDKLSATNVVALILKDTAGIASFTFSNVNFRPVDSRYGSMALVRNGEIADSNFPSPPALGTLAFDRENNRLYVKRVTSGGWLYFDMDGGEVLGPELVVNGSGESGTTGWTTADGATLANVSGALRVTNTAPNGRIYQAIHTVPGQSYAFAASIAGYTAGTVIRVGTSPGSGDHIGITGIIGGSGTFVATNSTTYVTLIINSSTVGHYADFDDVTLKAS